MGKTLTEMTVDIVRAQSKITRMSLTELANLLDTTYKSLKDIAVGISAVIEKVPETDVGAPPIKPKASIRKHKIVCLECGAEFKVLTRSHLEGHNLTGKEYRKKYGFSSRQPLTAKSLSAARRKTAMERGLGRKMAEGRRRKKEKARS